MDQDNYDVFISYSRKDYVDKKKNVIPGNVVSTVIDFLTSEGVSYWFDKKGISYGDLFTKIIPEKIEQAKLFLFISTQNSNNSLWTAREIKYASDKKKRIIVLRADNTPLTSEIDFLTTTNNRVNYFENPKEELKRTVESIKHYLADKALEEQEKDRQRKEKEEKERITKEQEQLIQEITVSCESLKNEEYRVKIERQKLLLRTDKILDKERKTSIQDAILNSSPIRKDILSEINMSQQKVIDLKKEQERLSELNTKIRLEKSEIENKLMIAQKNIKEKEDIIRKIPSVNNQSENRKFYWGILFVVFFVGLLLGSTLLYVSYPKNVSDDEQINLQSGQDSTAKKVTNNYVRELEVYFEIGKAKYTGMLNKDGKPDGEGEAVFPNRDIFKGTFKNGKLLKGRYIYKDGSYIEGAFKNDEPEEGQAIYYDKNGNKK